ncbi:MAG: hypothetical protein BMS9Abin36_0411 [Gammaproteobacteria bacterium]|nr:MAG: hypothetical protein BMS9Abin36_0411 [Gammaproteobacteria bacterium]
MATTSTVDLSTLGWVKTEIDESLKQARQALETFVEDTDDESQLRFCVTHLHQVVGTLEMVELDGAAMLARETEALVEALLDGSIVVDNLALDILTRGILTLPDYLGRLQFGQPDVPLKLLPVVNELRSVRTEEALSELELFHPDLSVCPPRQQESRDKLSEEEYTETAKKLRPKFQVALLNWLRDTSDETAMNNMVAILERLEEDANLGVVQQLFWVASGLLDAMQDGGLEATNERKKLFARLDQQIKKLIDGSGKSDLRNTSETLVKKILYQVGNANSDSPRVVHLKQVFDLDLLLGRVANEAELDIDELPTPELMQSVSVALAKEIESAQELLASHFDPDQEEPAPLSDMVALLEKMSGTMEMLGVPMLREVVDELVAVTRAVEVGQIEKSDTVSMAMARTMLLIENSARDIAKSTGDWKRQIDEILSLLRNLATGGAPTADGLEVTDAELTDTDFRQLFSVVAEEIRSNLTHIEEEFETYASDTNQLERLGYIHDHLGQIQGALQIVNQERAANLAQRTGEYVNDIISWTLFPNSAVLDALAVCIGTIGAYVDGILYNRPNMDALIDLALEEMDAAIKQGSAAGIDGNPQALIAALTKGRIAWKQSNQDQEAIKTLIDCIDAVKALADSRADSYLAGLSETTGKLLQSINNDPDQLSAALALELEQAIDDLIESTKQAAGVPAENVAGTVGYAEEEPIVGTASVSLSMDIDDEDFDEEIMEIFIEDARDSLDTINKNFTLWRDNENNTDALLEVRRGFHTIKGSGRMVGVTDLAELSWAVENMINKIRDGKLLPNADVFSVIEAARQLMPDMVAELEGGPKVNEGIEALRLRAHDVADGKAVSPEATAAMDSGPAETTVGDVAEPIGEEAPAVKEHEARERDFTTADRIAEDDISLDPTLLQIFTSETEDHIATIREQLQTCRNVGSCLSNNALIRAAHTLTGSARSVGLTSMSETCSALERFLQEADQMQAVIVDEHLGLVDELIETIENLVQSLKSTGRSNTVITTHLNSIAEQIKEAIAKLLSGDVSPTVPVIQQNEAAPSEAPVAAVQAAVRPGEEDDIDLDLVDIFCEEAVDILQNINNVQAAWRNDLMNDAMLKDLQRALHTFKGGARMAGAMSLGGLAHDTETMLVRVEQAALEPNADLLDLLDEVHDTLAHAVDQLTNNQFITGLEGPRRRIENVITGKGFTGPDAMPVMINEVTPGISTGPAASVKPESTKTQEDVIQSSVIRDAVISDANDEPVTEEVVAFPGTIAEESDVVEKVVPEFGVSAAQNSVVESGKKATEKGERREQIRVHTDLLDSLASYAGEVSIARSRMEQQIFGFRENLGELQQNVTRFRDQLRDLEIESETQIQVRKEETGIDDIEDFDPLEFDRFSKLQQLSRSLTESLHDLTTIQGSLGNFASEAEVVLQQQARVNTDLQEGLMRTRMVGFATQSTRLRHIVRQTSRELGKQAKLDIIGAEVELDRNVLERMVGPFEHMIRNALDHGLEDAEERKHLGKPPTGQISISVRQEGSEIAIRFSDDGAGLDIDAIRKKAIESGFMTADSGLSNEEVMQFILMSGFSTAKKVTQISGRGVGMDVVHNEVRQLGGHMSVETEPGKGTSFVIGLPLTISIAQALMVYVGEHLYAMPLASIVNILELPIEEVNQISVGDKPLLNYRDQVYPFMHLAARLDVPTSPRNDRKAPVLLARTGSREVAMQVDGLAGTREIVIKAVGSQINEVQGVAGATILGDGTVVLILDVSDLWLSDDVMHLAKAPVLEEVEVIEDRPPMVMVVDDSLTVRKITTRHLAKRGMDSLTANDGLDAIEKLRDHIPDIMLVDIEMPRMDGYELTMRVRNDQRLKHIPIIMITSRAGGKHREKAIKLGVDIYMSKPFQEEELFTNVESLLEKGHTES